MKQKNRIKSFVWISLLLAGMIILPLTGWTMFVEGGGGAYHPTPPSTIQDATSSDDETTGGWQPPQSPPNTNDGQEGTGGDLYAIVITSNSYPNVYDLSLFREPKAWLSHWGFQHAQSNTADLAVETLEDLGYEVIMLNDVNAQGQPITESDIMEAIEQVAGVATDDDQVFIYMAGHGISFYSNEASEFSTYSDAYAPSGIDMSEENWLDELIYPEEWNNALSQIDADVVTVSAWCQAGDFTLYAQNQPGATAISSSNSELNAPGFFYAGNGGGWSMLTHPDDIYNPFGYQLFTSMGEGESVQEAFIDANTGTAATANPQLVQWAP